MIDPISLATIFTSLLPTGSYIAKRVADYYTGGSNPSNSSEATESRKVDAQILEQISKVDNADGASTWVVNIRALQRPMVVYCVLFNWSLMTIMGMNGYKIDLQLYVIVANLASSVFFYLFGDRSLMYSLQYLNKKLIKG